MDKNNAIEQIDDLVENRVCISFKLNPILELDMSESEILGELRGLLSEHPLVKLHPNYVFICKGKKLKEYEPLSSQLPGKDANISISLELSEFTERTANEHILECCSFFLGPHKYLSETYTDFSIMMGKHDIVKECIEQQDLSTISEFVYSYDKIDLSVLCKDRVNNVENVGEGLFKKLAYSEHNPIEAGIGNLGDLYYLDFVDKHGKYSCITVNSRGIFKNESTQTVFSDKPSTRAYFSLFELLVDLSADLANELKTYIDVKENFKLHKVVQTDFYGDFKNEWLMNPTSISPKCHSLLNLKARLSNQVYGKSITMYRDWVEEFHNCRSLPANDTLQQLHKIKVLRKTHQDFMTAAEELAKAVVNQRLLPLNPNENRVESCYVYNNLFATYALDKVDWELPKSETAPTTYSAVNADIRNLGQIFENDISDVNVINTAAVDYMGCRVIVQSVVQGILHFDQKTWNCYGTIDDGKTMNFDEEFHNIMERLADCFHLTKNNKYVDAEGKEFRLHGSPEVKGIKAGDNRKYVMDLMRLSPRDLNYKDVVKHECCLLRPEIISNHLLITNLEANMKMQYMEHVKQQESNNKAENENNQEENDKTNQEKDKTNQEVVISENKDDVEEFNKNQKELYQDCATTNPRELTGLLSINPSLFTQIESSNDNKEEEIKELQTIAELLINNLIPAFTQTVNNNAETAPLDMSALTKEMHRFGINIRYLGRIHQSLNRKAYPQFIRLIERSILARSLKKVLRRIALEEDVQTFVECFAQCINIVLGNDLVRSMVDEKIKIGGLKKPVENKKKKNKKKYIDIKIGTEISPNLRITSEQLLANIQEIANERYGFSKDLLSNFNDIECINNETDKLAFLREMCLCFGVVLRAKDYDFKPSDKHPEYPVKPRDVLAFNPKTKSAKYKIEGLKYTYRNAEHEFAQKNIEKAYQLYKGCQQFILSAYGMLHPEFVHVTNRLSILAFMNSDLDLAIKTQFFTVKVSEKVHGLTHPTTANHIIQLSNFLYEKKILPQSIHLRTRALKIFDVAGTAYNANSSVILHELHTTTEEMDDLNTTCDAMQEVLNRNSVLYGDTDERLLFALKKLACLKAMLGDLKTASILQARHAFIIKQRIKILRDSGNDKLAEAFTKALKESEEYKAFYVSKLKSGAVPRKMMLN